MGRMVIGDMISDPDGSYRFEFAGFDGRIIVTALDDYGEIWRPDTSVSIGERLRPTAGNETGYVYQVISPGTTGPTEPVWWITGAQQVGTATLEAVESWWPETHAPIVPKLI